MDVELGLEVHESLLLVLVQPSHEHARVLHRQMASVLSNQHLLLFLEHHELVLLLLLVLHLLEHFPSLQEPLGVSVDLADQDFLLDVALGGLVFSLLELFLVHLLVHPVHFSHLLDLVEVNHKAAFVSMVFLDAFSAEHGQVVGAVKVLDALVVSLAQQAVNAVFVLEVDVPQDVVSFHDFVKDIEVQRQLVHAFNLLHQFSADGTSYSVVVVQALEALSAEGVSAVNQYPGYSFAHVELFSAIVTIVEASCFVVGLGLLHVVVVVLLFLQNISRILSPFLEGLVGAFGLRVT